MEYEDLKRLDPEVRKSFELLAYSQKRESAAIGRILSEILAMLLKQAESSLYKGIAQLETALRDVERVARGEDDIVLQQILNIARNALKKYETGAS